MGAAGRELCEAHRTQFPAHRLAAERYAEFLTQPLDKIDKPPADDAIQIRLRSGLNRLSKRGTLGIGEARRLAGRLQSSRPSGPCALKRTTQSRMICKPTPPILAAWVRLPPS